jgi:hypothetical protein
VSNVLQAPRLRRIIAAYAVNRLGTWFGVVALSLAVFDRTHSALAVAALLVAAQVVPAFLVPAVVARVEASPRGGELSALYVFEGIVTVALAILVWSFSLPIVLVLVALDGTAALTANALLRTEAARTARVELAGAAVGASRESVEADGQAAERRANAAINLAFSATFVLGPAVAGVLVAGAGAATALFIDAGSFLLCGALLVDLRPHIEEAGGETVAARLRTAWKFINAVPALRSLILIQGAALIFFESAGPIEVAYAKATLHAGDGGYGLLMAMWGVGVVIGGIVFARRATSSSLATMLTAGTLAVGLAYVGFALAPSLAVAAGAAVVGGVGNGVQWAPVISSVQRLTPPDLHGRVMGALESIGALSPALGLSLGGGLVALANPRFAFLFVGLGAALTTIGFARLPLDSAGAQAEEAGASLERGRESDAQTLSDERVAPR